jgi:hypothetical protein
MGSHVASYSVFDFFFVPHSHTHTASSPQVPPQCMHAGDSTFGFAFSFPVVAMASAATASPLARLPIRINAVAMA